MANVCACGCGELLREGSTRAYKRGHKQREMKAEPPANGPAVEPEFDETLFTIDDAAAQTPDDPEPKEQSDYKPKTTVRITAAVRRDVEGKLAFAFGLAGQTWSMIDPICGSVLMETGPDMAKRYTPLVCQSPDLVKWLTKSGSFILWVDALMATWPLLQVVFAHHIARTIAVVPSANGSGQPVNPEMFTVQ